MNKSLNWNLTVSRPLVKLFLCCWNPQCMYLELLKFQFKPQVLQGDPVKRDLSKYVLLNNFKATFFVFRFFNIPLWRQEIWALITRIVPLQSWCLCIFVVDNSKKICWNFIRWVVPEKRTFFGSIETIHYLWKRNCD